MKARWVYWGWLCVMACGVSEEDYSTLRGEAECRKIGACELGRFEYEYNNDLHVCLDQIGDRIDAMVEDLLKSCDYDPKEAHRCLSRIRSLSCADFVEGGASDACDQVYDCRDLTSSGTGTVGDEPTGTPPTTGSTSTGSGT
jgi:hypothetical protein